MPSRGILAIVIAVAIGGAVFGFKGLNQSTEPTDSTSAPAVPTAPAIDETSAADAANELTDAAADSPSADRNGAQPQEDKPKEDDMTTDDTKTALATFGSGCFWCTEAVFKELKGVEKVVSGYTGGEMKNPTYRDVCSGLTGHAEVIQVTYDPEKVTYEELLEVFWKTHDPTTPNRQGNDVGTQYRSAIFYHTDEQKALAEEYMKKLDESDIFSHPIVTQIEPIGEFYPAEKYHQDYFALNPGEPYCRFVTAPKVEKFRKLFRSKLKTTEEADAK
ncbi:MAG: peptide-methionine (S)-S-oxide reductase MsrA [Planctomycetaceae bacterium]